jgi:hypothetical protein
VRRRAKQLEAAFVRPLPVEQARLDLHQKDAPDRLVQARAP